MAENHPKSKLKRKKCAVEEIHLEETRKGTPKRDDSLLPDDVTAQADRNVFFQLQRNGSVSENMKESKQHGSKRTIQNCIESANEWPEPLRMHQSVSPAAPWWNGEQLLAAERLWMFTLKSALPYLDNQHWDLVPDFPQPSTIKPTALKLEEQRWCDLNEEVSPFPEAAPLRLRSSQQDLSVHTKPVPDPPDRQQSLHSRESHDGKTTTTTLQSLAKKTRPSFHCWEEATPPAGSSNVGSEAGRKGGERGEPQAITVNRQLHTNKMKMSDSRVSLHKEDDNKKVVVVEDRAAEEVQASVRGDGEGGLQSCPMCLMVFPVGFTQMDCDGHLAQCLSEMDVDMTW